MGKHVREVSPPPAGIRHNVLLSGTRANHVADVRLTIITGETQGGGLIRRTVIEELVNDAEGKRILEEVRDAADRALRTLWPEDREPRGKHEAIVPEVAGVF